MKHCLTICAFAAAFAGQTALAQDAITAWLDGRLSSAEYQSMGRARFAQADANGNGIVTAAEFTTLSLADFDRADRDRDGVIRRGEVRGLAPTAEAAALDAGFTRAQAAELAVTRFAQLDANQDDALTQQEHLARITAEFNQGDANRDGALTRGELRGLMAAQ